MIFFSEQSLRRAVAEFIHHYHGERNHQGLGNALKKSSDTNVVCMILIEKVRCRQAIGTVACDGKPYAWRRRPGKCVASSPDACGAEEWRRQLLTAFFRRCVHVVSDLGIERRSVFQVSNQLPPAKRVV